MILGVWLLNSSMLTEIYILARLPTEPIIEKQQNLSVYVCLLPLEASISIYLSRI